jgi:hypothetical protein
MIKRIKNKYLRRAVWLVVIGPVCAGVMVVGAALGAAELTIELVRVARTAW